jgi:hypothetical protein
VDISVSVEDIVSVSDLKMETVYTSEMFVTDVGTVLVDGVRMLQKYRIRMLCPSGL